MADDGKIWVRDEVDSPCVKICVVHRDAGLCTGCLRTLDEIASWSSLPAETRREIMKILPERRSELTKRRGGRRARQRRAMGLDE
ncbi:DUF1289 domain-containing protein [Aliiroseovarius crassostreae]|uniref:DUF1289 domain-containing protein n=1 Tax=Aliiroseovarius crassostreae TaxID=154981 RepID=UPI002208A3C3|nr:DUF1289 domain-containing protein [Aliiroseovarius crassostreae]UWP90014.1 DUF1289 domain-containing protein [Aliiroseovarius crassostreae]UWQ02664.1 DUF1289 domain-containing protein [Aliiroseovarius crassostreae]